METKEYRYVDKSQWDRGPWDDEPDKVQWQDQGTGLPCLAVRNPDLGFWCGYVGVAEGHPYFEQDYDQEPLSELQVHGGLTFNDFCYHNDKERGICHVPEPNEPDRVWWFGFDCGHTASDYSPGLAATFKKIGTHGSWPNDVYRDLDYVRRECAHLAQQLKKAEAKCDSQHPS